MPPLLSSANGTLILEEPLIRTPYELLRRSHRSAQRQVEKDFTAVQSVLAGILKSLNGSEQTEEGRAVIAGKLDQAAERAKGLKRKLDDIQPNETAPTPLRSRLTYLAQTSPETATETKFITTPKVTATKPVPTPPLVKEELDSTGAQEEEGKATTLTAGMEVDEEDDSEEIPIAPEPASHAILDRNLDRYLVDYLLRTGRMKAAQALADAQDIEQLVDIKLFAELIKVETALMEKHSCTEALAWCGENRGTLKKTKNNLEFTLRLQEFIELCRKRDIPSAIAYSRKNLSAWAGTHIAELQQGMTLLAFGEKTGVGMYRILYDQSRWIAVRDQFRETFLNLYAQPSQSILSLALSAGLSSLRLPSCVPHERAKVSRSDADKPPSPVIPLLPAAPPLHNLESILTSFGEITYNVGGTPTSPKDPEVDLHSHPEAQVGNIDCPTCGEDMKILAGEVPMSHHVNSTIVCRISGKVMDSENEPLAFPNGYVYSSKALAGMAQNNFDVVTCPRTRETCAFSRLRKVYIS